VTKFQSTIKKKKAVSVAPKGKKPESESVVDVPTEEKKEHASGCISIMDKVTGFCGAEDTGKDGAEYVELERSDASGFTRSYLRATSLHGFQ
jgi:hypothetical protein